MRIQLLTAVVLIAAAVASSAWAGSACCGAAKPMADPTASIGAEKAQTRCPVRGEPINKDVYVDYKGVRIYFCCAACKDTFTSSPEKYMKKFEAENI